MLLALSSPLMIPQTYSSFNVAHQALRVSLAEDLEHEIAPKFACPLFDLNSMIMSPDVYLSGLDIIFNLADPSNDTMIPMEVFEVVMAMHNELQ